MAWLAGMRGFCCSRVVLAMWIAGKAACAAIPAGALPLEMISAPALSADGQRIVFEWAQDLWVASSAGGEAKRIVADPARDAYPRFTPDGKRIVFSSDRSGSLQIYSMPVDGGETIRHTFHTEGNELECLSPDGTQAIVRGLRERHGYRSTRLMFVDLVTPRRERRVFDASAHSAAWSPDGKSMLFCRGGEQLYRKGYQGSRASQIWRYDLHSAQFTSLVQTDTESRSPLWLPDGSGFYYVSNKSGVGNLHRLKFGEKDVPLTDYQEDGIITPDLSADGKTLVFRMGLGVYRMNPETAATPVEIRLWTSEALPDRSIDSRKIEGTTSCDITSDGKEVIFSAAGELWRVGSDSKPPQRLTHTAAHEEEVQVSPDGKWLYYLKDDGIEANYVRCRYANGLFQDLSTVTRGTKSKSRMQVSPDGLKIAWVEGNGDLMVAAADGSASKLVFPCWDKPTFDWSPDGKWLAIAAEDRDANRDIWLAAVDGAAKPFNLTRHPGFEGSPRWSPDGKWLVFSGRREDDGKLELWRMDFRKGVRFSEPKLRKISTKGIEPSRVMWTPDSKSLWFQSSNSSTKRLISVGIDGGELPTIAPLRGVPVRMMADGRLLWRVGKTPEILNGGERIRFGIDATVERPRKEVLEIGFRRIWRTLGESYYDPTMNGRDWEAMRQKYEPAAIRATDSRQFDRVISLLRGELNASHLAFHQETWPEEKRKLPKEEKTAHPGMEFEDRSSDPAAPLVIRQVISGSPVSMLEHVPLAGETVVRIAGEPVSHGTPLEPLFNGAENRPLPLVVKSKEGSERVLELRCVSYEKARELDRTAMDELTRSRVAKARPGVAWVPVRDMNRETLGNLKLAVHRESGAEAMILDLRGNIGGRETDRMLNLFCQPAHSFTVPRGGPRGYPLERRTAPSWEKPLVVLCDQDTFSNGEIFSHAIKHLKRAPLVGTATAGGVISAVRKPIPDVGVLQIPFRGWFHIESGANLDARGAQPEHVVNHGPAEEVAGDDLALDKALQLLEKGN
jgi:tricorn protease